MTSHIAQPDIHAHIETQSRLGESPVWDKAGERLWWCDIPGRSVRCWTPKQKTVQTWDFPCEVASMGRIDGTGSDAPLWVLAMRDGLWRWDPLAHRRELLAEPPYDPTVQRFNDGKVGPDGHFWVGTLFEPRHSPLAHLYRFTDSGLQSCAGGVTVSNGLAWSPDGRTQYWTDTTAHTIYAMDVDEVTGLPGPRRTLAQFARKLPGPSLEGYGGRPDGAAVDAEGCLWVAMFEGASVLRLSPKGEVLQKVLLPVQCPTMPAFGGPDLCTLYVSTAREGRTRDELARQAEAGCVLSCRVQVPGLPVPEVRLGPPQLRPAG